MRRPKTKATTCPLAASSTHHSQRCPFLQCTNDHISSAHSRKSAAGAPGGTARTGGRWLTVSIFFQFPHHRLGTNAEYPRRVPNPAAIQSHCCNALAGAGFVHFMPILKLKRAAARRTPIPLSTIGCFPMPVHGLWLLTSWTDHCFYYHVPRYNNSTNSTHDRIILLVE